MNMTEKERNQPESQEDSRESLALFGTLLGLILLLAFCVLGPYWAGRYFGPAIGVASSVLGLLIWVYLGPRPMPGLVPGFICILGFGFIIGMGISQIIRLVP